MNKVQQAGQTYHVNVSRQDESRAIASSREHSLNLNIKQGGTDAGFNAVETLLAAFGTCILTNINTYIEKMHLAVNNVRIELNGVRQNDPPLLTEIRYRLVFDSPEPIDRLHTLHEISLRYGTVTNTLINGIQPQGEVIIMQEGVLSSNQHSYTGQE